MWRICCGCFYTEEDKLCQALADSYRKVICSMTLSEKVWLLTLLQSDSGHFPVHKIIGDIIGRPIRELKARVPDSKRSSLATWVTAIVIAFLELKCSVERGHWEMMVEKARTVVLNLEFIEKAKKFIAEL